MPGIDILEEVRSGSGADLRVLGSQYFVAGLTERGPVEPTSVSGVGGFTELFGDIVPFGSLTRDLASFFGEGGTRAWVRRIVGSGATEGTRTLMDGAGTPVAAVKLDAKNPGAWSADLDVSVEEGTVANTVTVRIVYKAGTSHELLELYRNRTKDQLVDSVNARSGLVTATSLAGGLPAAAAATALSAGTDDLTSVDAAVMVAALADFRSELGPGLVAIPGFPAEDIGAGLAAHCKATRRIGWIHASNGDAVSTVKADAAALGANPGAEFVGVVYPWVLIGDPAGGTIAVPPTGYVAGVRSRTIQQYGPSRPPAGQVAKARFVVGTVVDVDRATGDDLNEGNVSAIRPIQGSTRMYGYRSCSTDEANWYSLTHRDVLNLIAWEAEQTLESLVFDRIDSRNRLVNKAKSLLEGIAERYRNADELFEKRAANGDLIDPGYAITVEANPTTRTLTCTLAVRIVEAAELIRLTIIKVASDAAA